MTGPDRSEPLASARRPTGPLTGAFDWARWQTPEVRDLAWLVTSDDIVGAGSLLPALPMVLDESAQADFDNVLDSLDRLPVAEWLPEEKATQRLGRYAEQLVGAWLRRSSRHRLLGQGVVLERDGRTLGECDFLLQTGSGHREHWEMAVKFYLRTAPDASVWRGADSRDELAAKLATMRERQLLIHLEPEFQARFGCGWRTRALLRGWLYEPWTEHLVAAVRALVSAGNAVSASGRAPPVRTPHAWLHADPGTLARVEAMLPALAWHRLSRRGWLRPCFGEPASAAAVTAAGRLAEVAEPAFGSGGQPVMAAALAGTPDGCFEVARLMLVRPGWPHPALA